MRDELRHAGMPEHDLRDDMGRRYMEVVCRKLWARVEPARSSPTAESGALSITQGPCRQLSGPKVFQHARAAPTNSGPGPARPSGIAQACGLAARPQFRWAAQAETIVVNAKGIDAMRAYRAAAQAQWRKAQPLDCNVLFLINPILGERWMIRLETQTSGHAGQTIRVEQRSPISARWGGKNQKTTSPPLRQFDLDKPFPTTSTTNGSSAHLDSPREAKGRSILETP